MTATDYLNDLNQRYLIIHRQKEDLFWDTYMGLSDDHESSARSQTKWTNFLSNSEQITAIKQQIDMVETIADPQERQRTKTWLFYTNPKSRMSKT